MLVSVVIPSYNSEKTIKDAIESVLRQEFEGVLEIIVVDDCSVDNTQSILNQYQDKIKFVKMPKNTGSPCKPRNEGILASSGSYIAFLDHDDVWCKTKLKRQIPLFEDPLVGLVCSDCSVFEEDETLINNVSSIRVLKKGWVLEDVLKENFIITSTVIVRRDALAKVGMFDEKIFPGEDLDLWIRISASYKIDYIQENLVKYRSSTSQFSFNSQKMRDARLPIVTCYAIKYFENKIAKKIINKAKYLDAMTYYWVNDQWKAKYYLFLCLIRDPFNSVVIKYFLLSFFSYRFKSKLKNILGLPVISKG